MILWIGNVFDQVRHGGEARIKALTDFVDQQGGSLFSLNEGKSSSLILASWKAVLRSRHRFVLATHPTPFFHALIIPGRRWRFHFFRVVIGYLLASLHVLGVRFLCSLSNKKFVVDAADLMSLEKEVPTRSRVTHPLLINFYEWLLFTCAHFVLIVSEAEGQEMRRRWKIAHKKMILAPNGAFDYGSPLANAPSGTGKLKFVFAGTLAGEHPILSKSHGMVVKLIEAFGDIADKAELYICGVGGEWVTEYCSNNVHYLGSLTDEELAKLNRQCHIGTMLYFADNFYFNLAHPVKLSTYLEAGLPVFSGDAGTIAKFVEARNVGLIFSKEQVSESLGSVIANLRQTQLWHQTVREVRPEILWGNILEKAFSEIESHLSKGNGK